MDVLKALLPSTLRFCPSRRSQWCSRSGTSASKTSELCSRVQPWSTSCGFPKWLQGIFFCDLSRQSWWSCNMWPAIAKHFCKLCKQLQRFFIISEGLSWWSPWMCQRHPQWTTCEMQKWSWLCHTLIRATTMELCVLRINCNITGKLTKKQVQYISQTFESKSNGNVAIHSANKRSNCIELHRSLVQLQCCVGIQLQVPRNCKSDHNALPAMGHEIWAMVAFTNAERDMWLQWSSVTSQRLANASAMKS